MPACIHPVPIMPGFRPGLSLVRGSGRTLSHDALLTQAARLARDMPAAPWVFNLCEDRGLFLLSLCAALMRGVQSLFPPSRVVETIEEIGAAYPGALCLCEAPVEGLKLPQWFDEPSVGAQSADLSAGSSPVPTIDGVRESILVFTSGSTGKPQAHPKRWTDLMAGAVVAARRFGIGPETTIVATVPAQHMYGFELSVLVPLAVGAAVESGRPFFPEDIRLALARVPTPRVLVTTPVHLAACVDAMSGWPEVDLVISATAPLSAELAGLVERRLATRVCEIYGCTEAGSMASRRTLDGPDWHWYDSVIPRPLDADRVAITADFLPTAIPLADALELHQDGTFRLLGRSSDLIKIAGKRASLADLNIRLNSIAGVREGVFVVPDSDGQEVQRLAVVAVAPGLDRKTLNQSLRRMIDPAFLPRTLVLVDRLPRNETGKIPRERLLALLRPRAGKG